jgi:hypothetical protein
MKLDSFFDGLFNYKSEGPYVPNRRLAAKVFTRLP